MTAPKKLNNATKHLSDDWLAIYVAGFLLLITFIATAGNCYFNTADTKIDSIPVTNPFADLVSKPSSWIENPIDAFANRSEALSWDWSTLHGVLGVFGILLLLLSVAIFFRNGLNEGFRFSGGFLAVFLLATLAYTLAAHSVVKSYNLEYALWALMVGLIISNTVGTPNWIRSAVLTEFYIKTGLILLGAEVLMSRLVALGLPGIFVAWVVTPIVLISTYAFGQKVLKIESRSLNMVISADMSVCGVSAAIAAAAACKAKKEELSFAIGMSLSFTVIMMILMPVVIKIIGLNETVAGAWMGGTIDSTGAVAAAGAVLGDRALEVAATVKMIQNILIGFSAFGIATYWVTCVEKETKEQGEVSERPRISEIWKRFPRFVVGFIMTSIIFSLVHSFMPEGDSIVNTMIQDSTKTLRGWFFCLAFVSIGLETDFNELSRYLKGGKPLLLYLFGQSLNLVLTLAMAYLMFGILFK